MILVFGSTGNIGSAVVSELKAKGASFRAVARDPKAAKSKLGNDVEIVQADLSDRSSVDSVMAGAEKVFLVCGHSLEMGELEANAIEAAKDAGIKFFLKTSGSTRGVSPDSGSVSFRSHYANEQAVKASGMAHVILQPNMFMQIMLTQAQNIANDNKMILPWPVDAQLTMIDTRDIGAVAAEVMVSGDYNNETIYLSGAPSSLKEVAAELTRQLGREISNVSPPWESATKVMKERRMPDWLIAHQKQIKELVETGGFGVETDNVSKILGRAPRSLVRFVSDYKSAFMP